MVFHFNGALIVGRQSGKWKKKRICNWCLYSLGFSDGRNSTETKGHLSWC